MEPQISTLLVDDDAAVLQMLREFFEAHSFKITAATSAREAVSLIQRERFDLIITDMRMETPTAGFEVVKAAKSQNESPAVVAILTAYPIPASNWRTSGADTLIEKGADMNRVARDLQTIVRQRRERSESQARHPER